MEIKETLEVLEGVKVLAETGVDIFEDGKVNLADLPKLVELAKQFDVLKEAVSGIDDVDDELKDLDQTEIVTLVAKVFEIVQVFKTVKATESGTSDVE